MSTSSYQIILPFIYAEAHLKPKLQDPNFFDKSGLSADLISTIDSFFAKKISSQVAEQILTSIESAQIPNEVKEIFKVYLNFIKLTEFLLEIKSGDTMKIVQVLDEINIEGFDKDFYYEIIWSNICNEIAQKTKLADLKKYLSIAERLEAQNKVNVTNAIFLQISYIVDISRDEVGYLSELLNQLKDFACMADLSILIESLTDKLKNRLALNEIANLLPDDMKLNCKLESLETLQKSLYTVKSFPFSQSAEESIRHFSQIFKLDHYLENLSSEDLTPKNSIEIQLESIENLPSEDSTQKNSPEIQQENFNNLESPIIIGSGNSEVPIVPPQTEEEKYFQETPGFDDFTHLTEAQDILKNLPITSWDQIKKLERITFFKNHEKHLEVFKCLITFQGKELLVAVKCNYTNIKDLNLENQSEYMAIMAYYRNYLKLYGAFWDTYEGSFRYNLIMELAKYTLKQKIDLWERENAPKHIREEQVLIAAKELIPAMCELNAKDISHRDLKPDNIFITDDENGCEIYKIADFDVSKKIERNAYGVTVTNTNANLAGTMIYISPELRDLHLNVSKKGVNYNKSDVYSLGLTFLRMITKTDQSAWNASSSSLQRNMYELIDNEVEREDVKMILKAMIVVDYEKRPKFRELTVALNAEEATFKD
ncbi:hypothetical protein SteCoe_19701 [Stentor coeruleus]|uniref:Protein kinase domain-containing protein n=1 Tax=Stentor coeruleus TaxID=5963 RepID=A0A1R2BTM3_9CILI|nr:hypothetical protein SteCoe_19701 [Stentor coeruleus]